MSIAQLGYEIDSSQAVEAERNLDRMGEAAGRSEQKAGMLAGAFRRAMPVVASFAAGLAAAFSARAIVSNVAEFDKAMSSVQAITRATSDDLKELRDTALQLGATTEFSAGQAADGLRFLGMAGFNAAESVSAIPQVLDLATASGMGLAQAADTASNIMSAFSIAATEASQVTDALAAASSRANTDVTQLGSAMAFAGPVASAMGISVSDAAAAIGVMSDAGIQGGAAGTGLRRVLSSLANPTKQAADALNAMGIQLEDVNPATNELTDIVNALAEAGLDASEALTIFGDRGGPAILALTSQSPRLQELTADLRDVDGEASRMADTMRDNLSGDIQGLWSAVQSLIIALGDAGLLSVMRSVVRAITEFARGAALLVGQISEIIGAVRRLYSEQARVEKQIDNTRIALNDEMRALQGLEPAMAAGASMSVDMANKKLNEALARRENIKAIIEEQRALGMQTSEYKGLSREIEYLNMQSRALQNTQRDGGQFAPQANRADIEWQLGRIQELAAERERLLDAGGDNARILQENETLINRLSEGLAGASDGMVNFAGSSNEAIEATERLNTALAGGGGGVSGGSGAGGGAGGGGLLDMVEERRSAMQIMLDDTAEFFGALAGITASGSEKVNRVIQVAGAIQAGLNTLVAQSQVLADPTLGFWGKLAAYAKIGVAGFNLAASLRRGGGSIGSGSGGGAPPRAEGVSQQQTPLRRTIVELRGPDWVKGIVQPVMEQIYEASEDGQVVFAR